MKIRECLYSFSEAQPVSEDIYFLFCRAPTKKTVTDVFIHGNILPQVWCIYHIKLPNVKGQRRGPMVPASAGPHCWALHCTCWQRVSVDFVVLKSIRESLTFVTNTPPLFAAFHSERFGQFSLFAGPVTTQYSRKSGEVTSGL